MRQVGRKPYRPDFLIASSRGGSHHVFQDSTWIGLLVIFLLYERILSRVCDNLMCAGCLQNYFPDFGNSYGGHIIEPRLMPVSIAKVCSSQGVRLQTTLWYVPWPSLLMMSCMKLRGLHSEAIE